MLAATHLVLGLLIAHAAWLWAFLCGSALRRSSAPAHSREEALMDVVVTSACGIAMTGFATFVLGLAGLLYPATGAAAVVVLAAVLWLRGTVPTRAAFWRGRLDLVRRAASRPASIVWMLAVFISVPALVPDTGSDATFYYLSYAFDWSHAHRLAIDPWLRLPYTTNNWPLILTWPFVFGLQEYSAFVNWLTACLLLLLVYGFAAWGGRQLRGEGGTAGVQIAALLATVSLCTTPIFLHFVGVNMIDLPSALFFTVTAVEGIRGIVTRDARHARNVVVCGAFLIGMKISFAALFPLFGALAVLALRASGASRRSIAASLALLVLLAAPWYVHSFVLAGDPVPPILNLRFHHVDVKWSERDMKGQLQDLRSDTTPRGLLRLPLLIFTDPTSSDLRDWGVSVMGTLYPVAPLVLAYALFGRRRRISLTVVTSAVIVYGIAYWYLTSHLLRYELIFLPLLAGLLAMLYCAATRRSATVRLAALPLMGLLAIPTPAAVDSLNSVWITDYRLIGQLYQGRTDWLEQRAPAYAPIQYLCRTLHGVHQADDRVYVIFLANSQLFFKECGLQMIGDVFGPERYFDFARAVAHDDIPSWARRMHVGAFLVPSYGEKFSLFAGSSDELTAHGWTHVYFPQSDWEVFLSPQTEREVERLRRS